MLESEWGAFMQVVWGPWVCEAVQCMKKRPREAGAPPECMYTCDGAWDVWLTSLLCIGLMSGMHGGGEGSIAYCWFRAGRRDEESETNELFSFGWVGRCWVQSRSLQRGGCSSDEVEQCGER